jgi:hypothetical protein
MKKIVKKTEGLSGAYLDAVIDRIASHGIEHWKAEVNNILYTAPAPEEEEEGSECKEVSPTNGEADCKSIPN